jgi:tripartite-type tricarboxylate transporter receptor subunit TctC
MAAALSGEVSLMFGPIAQGLPHVNSGKLRALGVTGTAASPLLPAVKPLVEQGFPGLLVFNAYPVMAPAGTPDAIAGKVRAGLTQALSDPSVRERLEKAAIDPVWTEPEQMMRALAEDRKRWSELAKRAGIQSPN